MKVLLFNGSRREKGCTYTALSLIAKELEKAGIHTEIIYVGLNAVNGKLDELVKEAAAKAKEADGFVFGSLCTMLLPPGKSRCSWTGLPGWPELTCGTNRLRPLLLPGEPAPAPPWMC